MLTFDIEKLRSVYVYILKVTTDYVYVTTTRAGQPYRVNSSVQDTHNGHQVSKIRIHRSVSHAYSTFYASREFSRPWLASLNYYDDEIVSIEIQMVNKWVKGYQNADNWQSFFSQSIPTLRSELETVDNAWINGTEIFWLKPEEDTANDVALTKEDNQNGHWVMNNGNVVKRTFSEMKLDKEGHLTVRAVKFVRLGSMGLSILAALNSRKEIEAQNIGDNEILNDIVNKANLKVEEGKVLSFYPNADNEELEQICVFSPVLQSKNLNDGFKTKSKSDEYKPDEEKKVYQITSETNPAYANIDFAIRAAKTIGKLYGYQHTDDLDIQRIIEKTGEVNLMNIDENSRKTMPIHLTAMASLAYVFRFIYAEKRLTHMRDLSNMFRFCINKGLVYKSDIVGDFNEDAPSFEIPLGSMKTQAEVKNELNEIFS